MKDCMHRRVAGCGAGRGRPVAPRSSLTSQSNQQWAQGHWERPCLKGERQRATEEDVTCSFGTHINTLHTHSNMLASRKEHSGGTWAYTSGYLNTCRKNSETTHEDSIWICCWIRTWGNHLGASHSHACGWGWTFREGQRSPSTYPARCHTSDMKEVHFAYFQLSPGQPLKRKAALPLLYLVSDHARLAHGSDVRGE